MDAASRLLIEALHRSPVKYVLAITGGGTGAAAHLLNVPGGSRTMLEVIVPYGEQALADFLGQVPEQYCSVDTARDLAARAYVRAAWLAPRERVFGVGCTASLATDRPKKGEHRFHISVHDGWCYTTYSLTLTKGARDRTAEEAVVDVELLNALARAAGVTGDLARELLPGEKVETRIMVSPGPLAGFLCQEAPFVHVDVDGRLRTDAPLPRVLLPGSFNPIHAGHWALAAVAARLSDSPAAFEISIANVDKPALELEEIACRLAQFSWRAPVWLTRAPTFAEKSSLFPGTLFAVGSDTAARILEPRYYGNSVDGMAEALACIRRNGCRFLVAGRVDGMGRFLTGHDLSIPAEFQDLFVAVAESEFRVDVTSTQLRAAYQPTTP